MPSFAPGPPETHVLPPSYHPGWCLYPRMAIIDSQPMINSVALGLGAPTSSDTKSPKTLIYLLRGGASMLILTVTGITIMSQSSGATPLYELYYNPFSICSLMVLLTLRWKGEPKSPDLAIDPIEKEIDIYTGEQMSKEYLEKNWKGQVRKPPCL
jgi:hypothetical protein